MKHKLIYLAVSGAILLMNACAPSAEEKSRSFANEAPMDMASAADSTGPGGAEAYISSSAAVEKNKDTTRKFIRTADLKFKVRNVVTTTYRIEDIAAKFDGFVTYTSLNSNIDNKVVLPVSADSSLETTFYTVENTMVIRVPNTQLDTTLKCIAKLIDFLDYRVIKADDVGIQYLSNQLTQIRVKKHEDRLTNAIDNRGKKLNETSNAEENLLNKQEIADNAKIANLTLRDQINFSTINLNIYQRQDIRRELIANYKNIDVYEPGFGTKFRESLKFGWNVLEGLILFLAKIWSLIILGLVIFYMLKRYLDRPKK